MEDQTLENPTLDKAPICGYPERFQSFTLSPRERAGVRGNTA